MSRGHARYQERHHGLSLFGKDLVRRCSSHCELCNAQGVKLGIFEVPPILTEPNFEHCIMICDVCTQQIERPKIRDNNHWRCLNSSIWSPVPAVKVMAIAMLQNIAQQERWAVELLEQVYLEPDEQAWLEEIDIP
ncbi:phnA protein [Neptuniibacter sp. QD48_11]|uniref:phnA protein n=1 Tax=unclassified Neptuniibacter TaxID=2630693 RepID=UPI0039F4C2E4